MEESKGEKNHEQINRRRKRKDERKKEWKELAESFKKKFPNSRQYVMFNVWNEENFATTAATATATATDSFFGVCAYKINVW